MTNETPAVVLVSPNMSARMGGEALKGLLTARELAARGNRVIAVVHERCREEMCRDHSNLDVRFVRDGFWQRNLYRWFGTNWLVSAIENIALHRYAGCVARAEGGAIIHFVNPISPTIPRLPVKAMLVVYGPINGNIYYPPAFTARMETGARLRRIFGPIAQRLLSMVFRGKQHAAALLIAGGQRTRSALARAGVDTAKFIDTLDSGVASELEGYPLPSQEGRGHRFVCLGRLVDYKGVDLAIRALARADRDLTLDIIGDGKKRAELLVLAANLGVADRVNFLGWLRNGADLFERLQGYRGFIFPSLAEANGIVVQEAMMLGLPIVAIAWGGPLNLLDETAAIMIAPSSDREVVSAFALAMNVLADDPELARRLGAAAREKGHCQGFAYKRLVAEWVVIYDKILVAAGRPPLRRVGD